MMKNLNRFLVVLVLFVAAIGLVSVYQSGMLLKLKPQSAASEKAVYYCPMHPTYTSDRPGNCPICGMKLVKSESETQAGTGTITPREFTIDQLMNMKPGEICLLHKCKMGNCMMALTPELARLGKCPHCGEDLGIVIKEALPQGYGSVGLNADKQRLVGIKTDMVKKTPMTKTIRTVGRIAYDPELYQAEEEYIQAAQAFRKAETGTIPEVKEQAEKLVSSARIKLRLLGLGDELVRELETAGKADRSLLYSEAGDTVWLYAPVYEYEIPLVKVGDSVQVEVPAVTGHAFEGTIRSIDSVLDPVTRTVRIRAVLENADGLLKPEMYANATLQINLGEVLVVPDEAVFSTGERNIIFVAKEDGVFEPREVTLGAKSENAREVKSGVLEGEKVVTSGNFLIDSESRLKGALQGMGGGAHKHGS